MDADYQQGIEEDLLSEPLETEPAVDSALWLTASGITLLDPTDL
ncbi:MAG: hypothetical protein JWP32_2840 [Schumannella sp.]|jgi:hypothetical protein|nr:hypothetical protein [Schumannella sp.]